LDQGACPPARSMGEHSAETQSLSRIRWIGSGGGRNIDGFRGEDSMRLISFSVTISFALLSSAALAQQQTPESIGSPPPLPGPPPMAAPPAATKPAVAAPTPQGYTGAYAPPGTPPTPYSTGPLPAEDTGTGLNIVTPDGSTKIVKAVPCSTAARETDGSTTCVGLPDSFRKFARTHRRNRD